MEQLSKQLPLTLKMARQQAEKLRILSTTNTRRKEIRKLHFPARPFHKNFAAIVIIRDIYY
jgi:hypothetical protein